MINEFSQINHLSENARTALLLTNEERIERINSERWIGYDLAMQTIAKIERLMRLPRRSRMPNLLVVGDTNNGKAELLKKFLRKHPSVDNLEGDSKIIPVVMVQAPPNADEGRFYSNILRKLGAPFRNNDRPSKKYLQVITIAEEVKIKILIVDEIQDIIAGSSTNQRVFRNALKQLGNELQISIVAAGTMEALNAIKSDPQLSNRFEPVFLPRWRIDLTKDPRDDPYLKLLSSYERMLPLWKPSFLTKNSLALKLLSMSEGLIGELSQILMLAAEHAVTTGQEQIDLKVLKDIDWSAPSTREKVR